MLPAKKYASSVADESWRIEEGKVLYNWASLSAKLIIFK